MTEEQGKTRKPRESRLFEVNVPGGKSTPRLVEAMAETQVLRHVATPAFEITLPNAKRVAHLVAELGVKTESALAQSADPIGAAP